MEKINRNNIPEDLYTITQLKKQGLKPIEKEPKYFTHNQYGKVYYLYNINETKEIKKRLPTEKQLEALTNGRRLRKVCKVCNIEYRYITDLDNHKICYKCNEYCNMFFQQYVETTNIKLFKDLLDHKDTYIILDTETTGLEDYDQVIELSIIDLDGNVLFDSLFKPSIDVSKGAENIHGLDNKVLSNQPIWSNKWNEIKSILKDKTVLIYNSSFDYDLIRQTCKAFKVEFTHFDTKCLMNLYSEYIDSKRWVSLENAYLTEVGDIKQSHRALSDCIMCIELIKTIAARPHIIDSNLKEIASKVLKLNGKLKQYAAILT